MRGDEVIVNSAAQSRAADRLLAAHGSIRVAFESLGLGWTYDDVERYLLGSSSHREMLWKLGADQQGLLQGAIMALAIVCVERERGQ